MPHVSEKKELTIFTDGASRGNPGPASYGFVISDTNGQVLYEEGKAVGVNTNNFAEYTAVLEALRYVKESFKSELPVKVNFFADSRLVVEQLSGRFRVKALNLIPLVEQIRELESQVGKVSYTHVYREKNKYADKLANLALDKLSTQE